MIPLLDVGEMRALEAEAITEWGIPALVLQEHAALGALALLPPDQPLHVLAGPGNNGGDALALARLAKLRGASVEVWTLGPTPTWEGDAAHQAALWAGLGGTYKHTSDPVSVIPLLRGWVVDGLFGLGARRPLAGIAETWTKGLQDAVASGQANFQVLALDLPTGLDPGCADTAGIAVQAHRTACFGHRKRCHGLLPARAHCGEISVIPLPLRAKAQAFLWQLEAADFTAVAHWNSHKRQLGHVAIRAGRLGMSGAAVLAALGALRMGAGLVTVLVDAELRSEVAAQVPEAMVRTWDGKIPDGIDALLVGPGGVDEIPDWQGPLVLDASALRPGEGIRWMLRPETVLTPHAGEFARLFSRPVIPADSTDERIQQVREVATGPGLLALKGAQTLIAGGGLKQLWINPTGHAGLSTGGTGDFLAGMVVAQMGRWAQRGSGERTLEQLRHGVAKAVWMHGAAADRLGQGPLLVRELGPSLAKILRERYEC